MDLSGSAAQRLQTRIDGQSLAATQDAADYILRLRKAAKSHFGPPVLSEAAWNLVLALCSADSTHNGFHIGSIAQRADIPRSTALRWLMKLQDSGFVALEPDRKDKRAVRVRMTDTGQEAMTRSLTAARFASR